MGNLFQELKRRNVFRVGAAYAIVASVLIQVAEPLLPVLQMPDWTVSFVVVLLILGFPITLIMAWAFDLAPGSIRVDTSSQSAAGSTHPARSTLTNTLLGILLLAVGFLVVNQYVYAPHLDYLG